MSIGDWIATNLRLTSILGTVYSSSRVEVSAGWEAEAEGSVLPPGDGDVKFGEAGVDQHGGVGAWAKSTRTWSWLTVTVPVVSRKWRQSRSGVASW